MAKETNKLKLKKEINLHHKYLYHTIINNNQNNNQNNQNKHNNQNHK